jgi:hypothetical protein
LYELYGPCPVDKLEVRKISDHEWRVGDGRRDEQSPEKVLGYIQEREGGFEVLNMSAMGRDEVFQRWDAALGSFAANSGEELGGTLRLSPQPEGGSLS